jgi:hypothetical protein
MISDSSGKVNLKEFTEKSLMVAQGLDFCTDSFSRVVLCKLFNTSSEEAINV